MDATGSMHSFLEKAKQTVHIMFERASFVLKTAGLNDDCF
jgi:hypothetical protein